MTDFRSSRWALLAAILLTLGVAAALRLFRLPALPLGLHYDEAANGILAGEIARGARLPIFISSYTGKEVLFFYWAAAWMRVLGEGMLALRLTAAVVGICTVGAAAWSAYELLYDRADRAWIGVLTAAFVATSFWHLILSRYGFRAVTQPLLQALTVGALWRGLRHERRAWLALAAEPGWPWRACSAAPPCIPIWPPALSRPCWPWHCWRWCWATGGAVVPTGSASPSSPPRPRRR